MPTTRRPSPADERAAREARRLRAAELFAQGHTQAEVANQLGVSRQSAHVWHTRFQQGGVDSLRSRGPSGPDPKLSAAQLARVEQALLQGARANGFDTDLWTLERVAVVICQLTGVRYHPGHVWVSLRHRFGWKKASVAAALGYRPDGTAARLCFHLQQPTYNTDALIGVLEQLAGFYPSQRMVLIWDGLSAHWSTKTRAWLDSQRDRLTTERVCKREDLVVGFLAHTGLSLDP